MTASSVLDLVEPAWVWCPPYDLTLGPEVADLAEMAGFAPDLEQRKCLDLTFARTSDLRVVADEVGVVCSRQNMKTGWLKQCALGWLYVTEERLTVWSAHEFSTAQEAFRDMCELIEGCPDLDREVKWIHRGNGDEAIELSRDRRIKFKARTKGGGRGLTGNKVVLDEWMFVQAAHLGALQPSLSAVPNSQLILAGSAGLGISEPQRATRDRGRKGGDPSLAYIEWGDPDQGGCENQPCDHRYGTDGCALDDRARWRQANPAMGRRILEDKIASERRSMPPAEFARERLGWWDEPDVTERVIPAEVWAAHADPQVGRPPFPSLALDVSPWRDMACLALCGDVDGRPLVEVPAQTVGLLDYRPGTEWVVPRVLELTHTLGLGTVYLTGDAAASLRPDLERGGLQVKALTGPEYAQACGLFYDAAVLPRGQGLIHTGQPELDQALAVARRRDTEHGWHWDRRRPMGDITPTVAATVALWAHTTSTPGDPSAYLI